MQRQARRDTAPELALRRELWRRGLRYRVDVAPLTGLRRRADLVFRKAQVAVYVDGCFWHSCPDHATVPNSNRDWWVAKLEANVERDRDTDARLEYAGWRVVRVWAHEPVQVAADQIADAVTREPERLRRTPEPPIHNSESGRK
ncbi:MAG: mismatch endonuclease, patch repair protein [Acidimicrobiaceae bacterium]|nr:mismatch endonuclease, patch repair protein [Acidimicrobiaceae bacterium]